MELHIIAFWLEINRPYGLLRSADISAVDVKYRRTFCIKSLCPARCMWTDAETVAYLGP